MEIGKGLSMTMCSAPLLVQYVTQQICFRLHAQGHHVPCCKVEIQFNQDMLHSLVCIRCIGIDLPDTIDFSCQRNALLHGSCAIAVTLACIISKNNTNFASLTVSIGKLQ